MILPTLYINASYISSNGDIVDNWIKTDLKDGVNITVKDKIKDSKDVGKVFTAYSNQFKLPASKTNNKIFKSFANHNVYEGFDARRKHDAIIKLNGVDFKKGYIKLNKVNLVKNLPESYDIQFLGELTSLKNILGDHKLRDLESLGYKYTHEYNDENVRKGVEFGYDVVRLPPSSGGGVQVLAQTNKPMFKWSIISNARGFEYTDQGFHTILSDEQRADGYIVENKDRMNRFDLKPAMKLSMIFDAIQDPDDLFGGKINFNTDWLFPANILDKPSTFDELYLWMHNTKGGISYNNSTSGSEQNIFTRSLQFEGYGIEEGEWTLNNTPRTNYCGNLLCDDVRQYFGDGYAAGGVLSVFYATGEGSVTVSATIYIDDLTPIKISRTEDLSFSNQRINLAYALGGEIVQDNGQTLQTGRPVQPNADSVRIVFQVATDNSIGEIKPVLFCNVQKGFDSYSNWFLDENPDADPTSQSTIPVTRTVESIIPNKLLPDVKIIDFLSDIFKTFNLVAFEERLDDGSYEINIQSLDYYLDSGEEYDITQFVDIDKSTVERVSPYSTVRYSFSKPKTFLAVNQAEITGDDFGSLDFNVDNFTQGADGSNSLLFDGGKYKVQPKFEKMMYERIINKSNEDLTDIQWGWFANDNKENKPEPILGEPLLFYGNRKVLVNQSDYKLQMVFDGSVEDISFFWNPSSVSKSGDNTLHFNAEFDEYTREINSNSLFEKFHKRYIGSIYSNYARRQTVTAYLPPVIFTNLKLNDVVLINRIKYNIDSMSINITDAKTKLVLLRNDYEYVYESSLIGEKLWNTNNNKWEDEDENWEDDIINS
jgi:hypothetical protein